MEEQQMKTFPEFQVCDLTSHSVQEEIGAKGYMLIRGLLPQGDVAQVLDDVTQIISRAGWLLPGFDPRERIADRNAACGDPDPSFKRTYQEIFNLESFHALPHHPALRQVMKMLVGEQVLIHPKPIGRLIFPHCDRLRTHAHQDYRFMGGDPECFTVWIPLHDCPANVGPLQVLEGSHRFGYQDHEDKDLHVPEIPEGAAVGDDWVGGQVNAGDLLIFHSLTVHAGAPNLSDQMRISLDCRFQDSRRALNPANVAFAGASGKSWEKTYANWRSDDLKYYWKEMPLQYRPSKSEIEQLAETADSPSMRAKYARILGQLN
jgi:ectoine hydroxylase-related dioxygenase (phytanoyl-CoA dioxygenase family)